MKVSEVLKKECVIPNISSTNKQDVIREIAGKLCSEHTNINLDDLVEVLLQREKLCSTAVDSGVAIPHGKMSGISNIIAAFGRSTKGIEFESLDGHPTHLFILLLAPEGSAGAHLKVLARISNMFKSRDFRKKLMDADSEDEIYKLIIEEDEKY